MDADRQKILAEYVSFLTSSCMSYEKMGKNVFSAYKFLEDSTSVNRKGYREFKRSHATDMTTYPFVQSGVLDLMNFANVGYSKNKNKPTKILSRKKELSLDIQHRIDEFINYLSEREDYSINTMKMYRTSIVSFFMYFDVFNFENCKQFVSELEANNMSPKTIRIKMLTLETYSRFIKKPFSMKRPKIQRAMSVENVPTEAEYRKILQYLLDHDKRQTYFFIKILGTTGVRLSEFMQMRWEDILQGDIELKCKGNKYRRIFFTPALQKEVAEYISDNQMPEYIASFQYKWSDEWHRMTSRGVSERIKVQCSKCGVDERKLHPHAFRHFFAKNYLKKSKDVVELADVLGHSSVDTTRIYLQKSIDEQRRSFNKVVNW